MLLVGLIGYPITSTSAQPMKLVTTEIVSSRDTLQSDRYLSVHDHCIASATCSYSSSWQAIVRKLDQQTVVEEKVQCVVSQNVIAIILILEKVIPQDGNEELTA